MKEKVKNLRLAFKILNNETPITYDGITDDYLTDLIHITDSGDLMRQTLNIYYRAKAIDRLIGGYDDRTYYADRQKKYSANMKIHDWSSVEEAVDAINNGEDPGFSGRNFKRNPITKKQLEWLMTCFDNDWDVWDFWLEEEREFFFEDLKERWKKWDFSEAGFYGRGGGHFCLCNEIEVEYKWCHPEDFVIDILRASDWIDDNEINREAVSNYLDDAITVQNETIEQLKEIGEILDFANEHVKGMSFKYELMYRIAEKLETNEYKEWKNE